MYLEIDAVQYHIEIRGTGTPLVCLHGFSEDISTWNDLAPKGFQMILIDLVGHGASEKPFEKKHYLADSIVDAVQQIVTQLGIQKHYILGYSFGGRLALLYAIRYCKNLSGVILESTSYGICDTESRSNRKQQDYDLANQIMNHGIEWFAEYWSHMSLFATQHLLPKETRAIISQRRLGNVPHALANTLLCSGQGTFPCLKEALISLPLPVLIITGALDEKYNSLGKEFCLLLSTAKHVTLKGCGHNTHVENPKAFQFALENFLSCL